MIFRPSIELCSSVCQHSQNRYFQLLKEGYYSVVQHICRRYGMLVGVELYERDPGVSVDNSLLINTAYTFDGADVVSVLSHQIAGMLCFYFTSSLQLLFLAL